MRLIIILLSVAMIFAFGCISTNNAGQPAVQLPQYNNSTVIMEPTCLEHCMSQPHTQCVGEWNISGTYPDCGCVFTCETNGSQTDNNTQNGNKTGNQANETGNQTGNPEPETGNPTVPPGYAITPTDRSVSQILDDELVRIRDDFYGSHDGSFSENSYRWERAVPLGGSISMAPASDVLFDDQVVNSVEASAFIIFTNKADDSEDIAGVAICRAKSTLLDNYTSSDTFDIEYFPAMIKKHLRDCWIDSRDYNIDAEGDWLITYRFRCE